MIRSPKFIQLPLYLRDTVFAGVIGAALLATSPAPVFAAGELEEIVVTARYREENLQETPLAISALSAEDLEVRGFSAAYEIGYAIPNASLRPTQAAFGNTMSAFIRGIGQNDFLAEFEPGVGIYFDDVLFPVTLGSMVDLMDLERVEVLRGPQGTLFGRGSLGGAIRYISKKPQGDNTGSIKITTGSYDRVDLRASYDFAITDNLFARVTGVSKSRDGHQTVFDFACQNPAQAGTLPQQIFNRSADCIVGTQGGEDVTGARGTVRWAVNEDLEFTATSEFLDDNSEARADSLITLATNATGPFAGQLPVPFNFWDNANFATYGVRLDSRFVPDDPFTSYATYSDPASGIRFVPQTSAEQWGVSGKMDWNYSEDLRIEAILSYRELDSAFATDADQTPLGEQTVDGRQHDEFFTGEIRLSGRIFDRLDWTVGYFHYDGSITSGQQVSIPAFVPGPFLVNGLNITDAENNSVFGHGVYDINDRMSFTAGVRYSEDTKDEQFDNTIVRATNSASNSSFDWKVGLDYKLTEDILLYSSVATGYRPEAFNPRPFQITQFVPVDGEENTSFDVGIKGDFFDNRVRLNVAGFYIDFSQRILPVGGIECLADAMGNYRALVPAGTPGSVVDGLGQSCVTPPGATSPTTSRTFYTNIPAEITGVEVEGQWRPIDPLTLSGIFGLTDFSGDEFEDVSLLGNPAVTTIISDNPVYVPTINWSVSASYEIAMANGSTLTPRVDVIGQTKICPSITTNVSNPTVTDAQRCAAGHELVNIKAEWASPSRSWTVTLGGNNVTDKQYFLNKFDLTGFGQPTIEGQPGRPVEWFVTVQRNFE
jgi:iron complex outermembrane receptor protein